MDIIEMLDKAGKIAKAKGYTVRIYENNDLYVENSMTYMELGLYLVSASENIKRVDIRL